MLGGWVGNCRISVWSKSMIVINYFIMGRDKYYFLYEICNVFKIVINIEIVVFFICNLGLSFII